MDVKSVLTKEKNYKVEVSEKYTFNAKTNLEQYKRLFEELREGGYVKAHSFIDITWYLPCPIKYRDVQFNFDIGQFNSFSSSLKSYVLLRRKSGKKPDTIKTDLRRLKNVIKSTNGLKDVEKIKEFFQNPGKENEIYCTALTLVNYLGFHPIPDIQKIAIEILEGLKYPQNHNRDLPPMQDVLTFDECINSYFREHSIDETIKFYPIFLWWTLTNIIPIRPIEFVRIKTNCIEVKNDGSYWITISRFKWQSSSLEDNHWEQSVLIDSKTYQMIKNYLLWIKARGIDSEYLVPPLNQINKRFQNRTFSGNKFVTNPIAFHGLIHFFYEEVVEKKYGEYHLDKVTAGDTRHFAIMNLFLQGFNILSITRLAGHEEITSPRNYFEHAKNYSTSFVYKMVQKKAEGEIGSLMNDGFIGLRGKQVWRANSGLISDEKTKHWRKVDYGFCKDTDNFPNNCVEDCRLCEDYYIFKPSVNEWNDGIKWLESYSNEQEGNITNILDLMSIVSLDTYNGLKGIEKLNENESKSLSIQLFKYLDHKAIIDVMLMEEQYKNE